MVARKKNTDAQPVQRMHRLPGVPLSGKGAVASCDLEEVTQVENRIFTVRGEQVILDSDLAMLYGTVTKRLNEQVQRNVARFPTKFMFQLSREEFEYLRSQNASANLNKRRSLPYVFTEHGVIMAAAILKSEIAAKASVKVVEAFVAMRRFLAANAHVFQRLETIEYKLLESDHKFEDIYAKLEEKSLKPQQGIFFDGQIFDAYELVCKLIRTAESRIILIDNYVDESVLSILDKRNTGVTATIYTQKISTQFAMDIAKHDAQYPAIDVRLFAKSHDRFLIIDDCVYHVGASIKDMGKKWFAILEMKDQNPDELISRL